MKTVRQLIFLLMIPFFMLTACGGDEDSNEPGKGNEIEDISRLDFIGVWKLDSDDPVYIVLEADQSGSIIEIGTVNGEFKREEAPISWSYNDQTLTIGYDTYIVVRLTDIYMTLLDDDGDRESYVRIKKSEIPDGNGEQGGDNGDDIVTGDSDLLTRSAEPSAFKAVLRGRYMGNKRPETMGFQYSYDKSFPDRYTAVVTIDGAFGDYSMEAKGLVDLAKVYYRSIAQVNGKTIYGETKSFETLQGTYKIDGKEYKFIKITGLSTGSYSMMQTELPPDAIFEIEGKQFVWNKSNTEPVTKGETREFLNNGVVLMRYPTPKEWMFAANGGRLSNEFTYSGSNNIEDVAWYAENSHGHARTPALKEANDLGFYDMSGNYAELCADFDDDELEGWKEYIKKFIAGVQNISAAYFQTCWNAGGGAFGGSWQSEESKCTTGSSVSSANVFAPDNLNRLKSNIYAARFVYSRPD